MDKPLLMMLLEFSFASFFRFSGMLIMMWSVAIIFAVSLALVRDFWKGK